MSVNPPAGSLLVVVARVFWLMCGPMILLLLLFKILSDRNGWMTNNDIVYWVVLGLLPLSRWVEFRDGESTTSMGEPATSGHLRRYVVSSVLLGAGAWVLANLIGNHVLSS